MKNIILITFMLLISSSCIHCERSFSKIKSIGACDQYARCSIGLDDGFTGETHYPLIGKIPHEEVCYYDKR